MSQSTRLFKGATIYENNIWLNFIIPKITSSFLNLKDIESKKCNRKRQPLDIHSYISNPYLQLRTQAPGHTVFEQHLLEVDHTKSMLANIVKGASHLAYINLPDFEIFTKKLAFEVSL